jgi:hypothetical protein
MQTLTSSTPMATLRLGLSRATLALLDGDARLAELVQRDGDTLRATSSRMGTATIELAAIARKRAPKRAVPDRLHAVVRAMAREADAMIEAAVTGHPVDPSAMNLHVDTLLARLQSESWPYGTKAARRAIDIGNAYATIADAAVALGTHSSTYQRRVA